MSGVAARAAPTETMTQRLIKTLLASTCMCLCLLGRALAGEFVVSPTGLDLAPTSRSGAITVRNDGQEKLGFQLEALEWRQDADGKDEYVETQELLFFPKLMSIQPGEEALVRVGTKTPVVPVEKSYRLFIQELPAPSQPGDQSESAGKSAQVKFLIRFGAPVFVAPAAPRDGLLIEDAGMVKGAISLRARNSGNRHQVLQGVRLRGTDATGAEVFAVTLADRYLLAGAAKRFSASVPPASCARLTALSIEVTTDRLSTSQKLDVDPRMCPQ